MIDPAALLDEIQVSGTITEDRALISGAATREELLDYAFELGHRRIDCRIDPNRGAIGRDAEELESFLDGREIDRLHLELAIARSIRDPGNGHRNEHPSRLLVEPRAGGVNSHEPNF